MAESLVLKANPFHAANGRFTTRERAKGTASFGGRVQPSKAKFAVRDRPEENAGNGFGVLHAMTSKKKGERPKKKNKNSQYFE